MSLRLVPSNPGWRRMFVDEAMALQAALGRNVQAMHHIGSTAITGIVAKPIIDMLCVVHHLGAVDSANPRLQSLCYIAKGENGIEGRRYFQKSAEDGRRSHHLHVFETGSPHIERHLAFRDYLLAHPDRAADYSTLKSTLAETAPSKAAYQEAKSPFIQSVLAEAVTWYRQKQREPAAGGDATGAA